MDVSIVPEVVTSLPSVPLRARFQDERQAPPAAPRAATPPQPPHSAEVVRSKNRVFTIHVAATANARHARGMLEELKRAGHAAYLVEPRPDDRDAYEVRVGRFSKLADANRAAYTLEQSLGWRVSIADASATPAPGGGPTKATTFER